MSPRRRRRGGSLYPRPIARKNESEFEVDPERAAEMVADGAALIDVRQDHEWEAGHIELARHVRLDDLPVAASELDRERPVIFQCRGGGRSTLAMQAFREAGFDAYNLTGGVQAWVDEGRPLEPPDGEVADPRPDAS